MSLRLNQAVVDGATLRAEREAVGVSASDLARVIGCTPSNIAHMEKARRPRASTVRQFRDALAVATSVKDEQSAHSVKLGLSLVRMGTDLLVGTGA